MVRLSLQYPNGRTHSVDWDDETMRLAPGKEFELYGRRWRVIGHDERRRPKTPKDVLICTSLTAQMTQAPPAPKT